MNQHEHQIPVTGQEEERSFDDIAQSTKAFARSQKQRFQDYVSRNNPELANALNREAARFEIVRRWVIAPAMREVAQIAQQRGYHVLVVEDDALDRIAVLGTPSIRFYCSRREFYQPVVDLLCPPSFVAYYGCIETQAVQCHLELSELSAEPTRHPCEIAIHYSDITKELVLARLLLFLEDLTCSKLEHSIPQQ